jgi:predicted peroxiredoxin
MYSKTLGQVALVAALLLAGFIAVAASQTETTAAAEKPAILINVTSGMEDLHAVSMGLGLARTSLEHGHSVLVFLNVHAPIFASRTLGDDVKTADFAPVKELLAGIIAKGGTVMVCGHCAEVCSVPKDGLVEGVKISSHGDILDLLKPGMVSFTY